MRIRQNISIFGKILLPFCIGIWVLHAADNTKLNLPVLIFIILTIILSLIISFLYRLLKVYHHKELLAILINLLFFSLGLFWYSNANLIQNPANFSNHQADFLRISVADEPQQHGSILRFKARVLANYTGHQKQQTSGYLLVALHYDSAFPVQLQYGENYYIPARYKVIAAPYNPAEFDFSSWLAMQNIHHQIFLQPEELIASRIKTGPALISFVLALRKNQVALYRRLIKDDNAFAVASTLILGYRADLSAETLSAYSKTGTIHALSVSGMHVGIIYLVLNQALGWMDRKVWLKWSKVLLLLILIWGYAVLTGCSASVLRSAIMLSIFILAKSFQNQVNSYQVLYFSAFCLLLYNPFLLWDVGFQLSYLAVLGLIYLQPKLEQLIHFKSLWLRKLWSLISLSIAAQLFTFPLSSYYFHQFPVYFILSNLFIVLPVTLLMYIGMLLLLFRLYWIAPLFEWLIIFMNRGLEKIAALPCSSINMIWFTKPELLLLCLFLLLSCMALQQKNKYYLALSLLTAGCFQVMLVKDELSAARQQKIIPFTLNRNYAVAFISSNQAILITDLLPGDPAFKFHIQPALDQLKISEITCLKWKETWTSKTLQIREHQLFFRNFRVLLLDTAFNHWDIKGDPVFDAIWVHGEPQLKMDKLRSAITFKEIWVDATNRNYSIQRYQKYTINFSKSILVLKPGLR